MLTVIYQNDKNCPKDMRFFKDEDEFIEWFERNKKINPDCKIISKES